MLTLNLTKNLSAMTYSILFSLLFAFGIMLEAQAEDSVSSKDESTTEKIKCDPSIIAKLKPQQRLLHVQGMVCGMCVQGITKLLKKIEGVTQVDIDLEKGSVLVELSEQANPKDQMFKEAITNAGYHMQDLHKLSDSLEKNKQKLEK